MRKLPSESGEAYLKRLAEKCSEGDRAVLTELAALVEQSFYGRKKPSADAAFCRAVRSCSFSAAGTLKQDR